MSDTSAILAGVGLVVVCGTIIALAGGIDEKIRHVLIEHESEKTVEPNSQDARGQELKERTGRVRATATNGFSQLMRGILGFAVGFIAVAAIEALLFLAISRLLGHTLLPRGLGWLALPVMGGLLGWRLSRSSGIALPSSSLTIAQRLTAALYASWTAIYVAYAFLANPYGYRWYVDDYQDIAMKVVIPPTVIMLVVLLFRWALLGKYKMNRS